VWSQPVRGRPLSPQLSRLARNRSKIIEAVRGRDNGSGEFAEIKYDARNPGLVYTISEKLLLILGFEANELIRRVNLAVSGLALSLGRS
jgi:hypothetical protein